MFVSYRHRDGAENAAAWLLRAAGIPAWHDESDLPLLLIENGHACFAYSAFVR